MIEKINTKKELNCEKMAEELNKEDIIELIKLLNEKDNNIRHNAFCLLEARSLKHEDVYRYFDIFALKLISNNSYQRSIGLMLIAANAKWDSNKIDNIIKTYLSLCDDESAIIVRQCLQGLYSMLPYKKNLWDKITSKLVIINYEGVKDTMRKLIALDAIKVLNYINKESQNDVISNYFKNILDDNIFDERDINELKKQIEA